MIDLKINKNGGKEIAEYLLKPNDRIDNLTLGMMVNNDIKGFVPATPIQADSNRYFKYDITGLVTVKEYLEGFVKKEQLLKTFYGIATTISTSVDYMINWTSFSLDVNEVYVDKETNECKLICLPLLTVVNDGNLCNFFKMILFSTQFDTSENNDYIGSLMNFLNQSTFALDKFIYNLEEMLEMEHPVVEEAVDDFDESALEQNKEDDKEKDAPEEKTEEETTSEETEEDKAEEEAEATESTEEKSEETTEDKPEESGEQSEKKDDIVENEEVESDEDEDILAVPVMTKEELETAEVEKNVSTETEVKTLSPIEELMGVNLTKDEPKSEEKTETENDSEEKSEYGDEPEEETEEEAVEVNVEDLPYLQKTRHGDDKIPITKDVFYVGKAEDVDYRILDDPMIEDKPAYIIKHGEEYFLVDMNSPMGTYMNGTMIPVEKEIMIEDGARIKFGEYDYIFNLNKKD